MTLIESHDFEYLIINSLIESLVIKIAIIVNKAVLLEIIIPAPGLIQSIVELPIADPDPIKISVIFNNFFFLFKLVYFFYNFQFQF